MRGYCPDVMIYRKFAGNIVDTKTIRHLLSDLEFLGHSKIKRVMDRGCYSEDTISTLFRDHVKFLVSAKMSLSLIRTELDAIYPELPATLGTSLHKFRSKSSIFRKRSHSLVRIERPNVLMCLK